MSNHTCVAETNENGLCELIILTGFLNDEQLKRVDNRAGVFVLRNGINFLFGENVTEKMYLEQNNLEWDKKYWDNRRKKVLNKIKR